MTDETIEYGLGGIPSPPDERDWPAELLFATAGIDAAAVPLPATYRVPAPYPPVLNQGNTPRCVAFSSERVKAYQDQRDSGLVDFDEDRFFAAIGGGPNGAYVRAAMARLLSTGYPEAGGANADRHKITAYYAVPLTETDLKTAIVAFGPIVIVTAWYRSWFRPVAGVLPAPDVQDGYHAIVAEGYNSAGLELVNSWGTGYGLSGRVTLPWAYLDRLAEAWKAVDQVIPSPPASIAYHVRLAPRAVIRRYTLDAAGRIKPGWKDRVWGPRASSAPCTAPVVRKTTNGKSQATTVTITAGPMTGWVIRGYLAGVTVSRS